MAEPTWVERVEALRLDTGKWRAWAGRLERERAAVAAKRAMDLVVVFSIGLLALPVIAIAALLVRLTSEGPVIYRQVRVGYRCRRFTMYKLRTMYVDAAEREARAVAAAAAAGSAGVFHKPRCVSAMTPVGRVLRRLSIDELPQLWNVVKGDMSLIGPRPLLTSEFERFPRSDQLRRFAFRPGITGLWQVSGRSELSPEERMRLDLDYVDKWSPMLDLRILWRTPRAVLTGEGAW